MFCSNLGKYEVIHSCIGWLDETLVATSHCLNEAGSMPPTVQYSLRKLKCLCGRNAVMKNHSLLPPSVQNTYIRKKMLMGVIFHRHLTSSDSFKKTNVLLVNTPTHKFVNFDSPNSNFKQSTSALLNIH